MTIAEGDEHDHDVDTGRVLALSDGVFAIAATLLVLDVRLPDGLVHDEFLHALHDIVPALRGYLISYVVIGMLWLGHHRQFRVLETVSRRIATLNLLLLGLVALLPFPSSLIARYEEEPLAVTLYSLTVAAIFLIQTVIALLTLRGVAQRKRLVWVLRPAGPAVLFLLSAPAAPLVGSTPVLYSWIVLFVVLGQVTRRLAAR